MKFELSRTLYSHGYTRIKLTNDPGDKADTALLSTETKCIKLLNTRTIVRIH